MRGTAYRKCWCRNPDTGRPYTKKEPCPKLKSAKHGKWYARYDTSDENGRRQPVLGPFASKGEAEEVLAEAVAAEGGGGAAADRTLRAAAYCDLYMAGKRRLKRRTRETDQDAFDLYWKPGLGPKLRLVDVRDHHVSAVIDAMMQIGRLPEGEKPSEVLRRMLAARADDNRRELPEGEERRKKYLRPLSPARIERMYSPFRAAMNAAVKTRKIRHSPCDGVELPKAGKPKPLAWTAGREAKFREEYARRLREAGAAKPAGRVLGTVERQAIWGSPEMRPVPSMVWLPSHAGQFLDYIEETGERLAALFITALFAGPRRDEVTGLPWPEVDLDAGILLVRETATGDGPKSDAGNRAAPLPDVAVDALKAWRRVQAADRLKWGPDWHQSDRVFTHEEGTPVTGQWASRRFQLLAYRAGLPPVRFHDLRHAAASLAKAAGHDTKYISSMLGHSRTSFTDAEYITLFPEFERAAANATAAVVPRSGKGRKEGAG